MMRWCLNNLRGECFRIKGVHSNIVALYFHTMGEIYV